MLTTITNDSSAHSSLAIMAYLWLQEWWQPEWMIKFSDRLWSLLFPFNQNINPFGNIVHIFLNHNSVVVVIVLIETYFTDQKSDLFSSLPNRPFVRCWLSFFSKKENSLKFKQILFIIHFIIVITLFFLFFFLFQSERWFFSWSLVLSQDFFFRSCPDCKKG